MCCGETEGESVKLLDIKSLGSLLVITIAVRSQTVRPSTPGYTWELGRLIRSRINCQRTQDGRRHRYCIHFSNPVFRCTVSQQCEIEFDQAHPRPSFRKESVVRFKVQRADLSSRQIAQGESRRTNASARRALACSAVLRLSRLTGRRLDIGSDRPAALRCRT